jgi:membrane-bound serine protease (ClpP class)
MPFAIAVVSPPAAAYAWLVVALAGIVYAAWVPRVVTAFGGASAAVLSALGYVAVPPDAAGVALLALGVLLLNVEFLRPTFGVAAVAGFTSAAAGSWRLLAATTPVAPLPAVLRAAFAVGGALVLLIATERAVRRHTLPR